MNLNVFQPYNVSMNEKEFGWRVLMSRKDVGMTQVELASLVNISRPYLTNIERGRIDNVGIRHIENLASALGVTVEYLIGLSEDPLPAMPNLNMINDEHVVYEINEAKDRPRLQRLIEYYLALDSSLQEIVLSLATSLHDIQTVSEDRKHA